RLQDSTERARRMLTDAQQKVDSLRALRVKISNQLREARSMLAAAAAEVEPLPEEEPSGPQPAIISAGPSGPPGPSGGPGGPGGPPGPPSAGSRAEPTASTSPEPTDAPRPRPTDAIPPELAAEPEPAVDDQAASEERPTNRAVAINRL